MPLTRELIYIDDKNETDRIAKYWFKGDRCIIVYKTSSKEFSYSKQRAKIVRTAVSDDKAFNVYNYLKDIADSIGIKTDDGDNILLKSYETINEIPAISVLTCFLEGRLPSNTITPAKINFFPFSFNLSQKDAVTKAFNHKLSVIEGPPGTGKTQTILNIIASAVLNGKSVAVVSSNNSATKNVYEKLEKNGIAFIAALLGNSQNKQDFIDTQKEIPDLSSFELSIEQETILKNDAENLETTLSDYLNQKNELASLKRQLDHIITEYEHFKESTKTESIQGIILKRNINTHQLLEFWISLTTQLRKKNKLNLLNKIIYFFKYGIRYKTINETPHQVIITGLQNQYYLTKINEINASITTLKHDLTNFAFDSKMKDYTHLSMQLLKAALFKKYYKNERTIYKIHELHHNSMEFIKDYPVIMSTTYSLRQSLSDKILYDYVIIDEASQVDLATGALALSCAKRAVIVGDTKQLPNVINTDMALKTNAIFEAYKVQKPYNYASHSLLSSLLDLFPKIPKTLLKEHYRCHPKIIEFCNKKFYNDQLIILSETTSQREPLKVYKTVQGNHARERINQRQIDIIKQEIIPNEMLQEADLGIVTPYRNQTSELQRTFKDTGIKADTVDKFQGRENEVIILSTVDNDISDFTDNANRLNVAVSRAVEQLIVVVNGNEHEKDCNMTDLIKYIEYNNFSIIDSQLNSIFDLLYKDYEDQRAKMIIKAGKVSAYDSENLMYAVIKEVLNEERFSKYDILTHYPFKRLIRDFSKLGERELQYATHTLTHLDFLIYNKLSKTAVLGIEVDGFEYHKAGSEQAKRDQLKDSILAKYNFPLLRFKTNESNEKHKLSEKLMKIQHS